MRNGVDHRRAALNQLRCDHAALRMQVALLRLELAYDRAVRAAFNPNQPRVPAGSPDGGQWTDGDDADPPVINDPPIEEVYPELLILPFLRIPRMLNAWRLWALSRRESRDWTLGKFKSDKRWASQLEKRDWTPEKITETIKHGKRFEAPNNVRIKIDPRATATRYEYNGRYVVRDDLTGEILQVSGPSHTPQNMP